ncbi:MAG: glycoside hydrolase family 15 protein [Chloroflexi bacterium]|nr:glycoside hydrolase family 15 protein [Chloroflexota bacterium]
MDTYSPIADYALISDCHSAALVSRDGSVDWCCFERFDARPVFARLIDWSRGGHFLIRPGQPYKATRRYLPGTNVLETRFETDSGVLVLTDCLAVHESSEPSEAEAVEPYRQLIRSMRCEVGEVQVELDFQPRFDYGLTTPQITEVGPGLVAVYGGADALILQSDLLGEATGLAGRAGGRTLRAGERASAVLTYAFPHQLKAMRVDEEEVQRRVEVTCRFWTEWSRRCTYEGPYKEQVLRSALVLKALTNAPTGALVAAPTTSLPEGIGGVRNWDYRYTWLRDSSFTLYALFTLGYTDEAHAFMRWLERTTAGHPDQLQVVYGVGGERFLPEIGLLMLDGYRGSRPVRIGNNCAAQFQLDVYGEVLDTAWLYHRHGGTIRPSLWDFLSRVTDYVGQIWTEPDEGIWEVRGPRQHFVYSKVMAWVAVDRAIRLARELQLPGPIEQWQALRAAIRQRIDAEGVDPGTGAFVQAFGSSALDASALLIPLVRFARPNDPRVLATLERIATELSHDGLIYRYLETDDGLPGNEATFLICSFWLVDNLVVTGQVERGRALFERLVSYANDVGLLAEELDAGSGEMLGNFPQAFSHMGLINSAIQLQKYGAPKATQA